MKASENSFPPWRLLVDHDQIGARNMARDVALLEGVIKCVSRPTLRFYGWSVPCLSLGRHQSVEATDLIFCKAHGIDVVRRPTGGRAVLHHLELTYAIIAPLAKAPLPKNPREAYTLICSGLVAGCRKLGLEASLTVTEVPVELPGPRSTVPCFKDPAAGEVVVSGRKIVGSAMRSRRNVILQHGTILLDWDPALQAGSMGLKDDSTLRPFVTTFKEQLGTIPERPSIENALVAGLSEKLPITFTEGELSAQEIEHATSIESSFVIG